MAIPTSLPVVLLYHHSQPWEINQYQMPGLLLRPSRLFVPVATRACVPDAQYIIIHQLLVQQRLRRAPTQLPVPSVWTAPYCLCQQAFRLPTSICPLNRHNRRSLTNGSSKYRSPRNLLDPRVYSRTSIRMSWLYHHPSRIQVEGQSPHLCRCSAVAGSVNAFLMLAPALRIAVGAARAASAPNVMMGSPERRLQYLVNGVRVAGNLTQIRALLHQGDASLISWR